MPNATIYIHPGANNCNVYLIPFVAVNPASLDISHRQDWKLVGMLNNILDISWLDQSVHQYINDIEGAMGGTFFHVEMAGE